MSFAERLVVGLVILSLVLGIILLWLISAPTGPCEDLGDWAKPVCKNLTWPAGERFNFPISSPLNARQLSLAAITAD